MKNNVLKGVSKTGSLRSLYPALVLYASNSAFCVYNGVQLGILEMFGKITKRALSTGFALELDCTQSISFLAHSIWETGASERQSRRQPCSLQSRARSRISLTPVSRAVAHLAHSSLSITKRIERDCVQSKLERKSYAPSEVWCLVMGSLTPSLTA